MKRNVIATENAPKAIGPYSQAIELTMGASDKLLFVSGQTPLDPASGKIVEGSVAEQTQRCLDNIGAILTAAGSSPEKVVKTTVFLTDMADFQAMNAVYASFFGEQCPARSTIAVKGLPLGAHVEIEAIACAG